jgi:filamentous hemagglutinin family protein
MNIQQKLGMLLSGSVVIPLWALQVQAQSIVPEVNGTGTVVNAVGNQLNIGGGQVSGDGANLFHSFERFGLATGEAANFLTQPQVQSIFGRVMGGQVSNIDGLLRVTGGNANLFLMNPAGIVFGPNTQLNLPAAFTATTANGIGFGGQWFSAIGSNDYARLVGSPDGLAFTMSQPGAIANFGDLVVGEGQGLTLAGGAVLNAGRLVAPGGNVTVSAIDGGQIAKISAVGSVLSLAAPLMGNQP